MKTLIAPPPPARRPWRIDVPAFHQMIRAGLFGAARVELIDGQVCEKPAVYPPHSNVLYRLTLHLFGPLTAAGWVVRSQLPVTLPPSHEPIPDFVIAAPPVANYDDRNPGPKEIALLVKISDSTLTQDRSEKAAIYAAAKIAVYWIINIPDGRIEVHTRPRGGQNPRYLAREEFGRGSDIPIVLSGAEVLRVAADDLTP